MKYKITFSKGSSVIYDNLDNSLTPEPDFSFAKEIVRPLRAQIEPQKPTFNSTLEKLLPIKHLRVQLGLACNYKCSFCIQQTYDEKTCYPTDNEIESVVQFIASRTNQDVLCEFWGGEPLIYIKALRKLLPAIRKVRPAAKFSMISNGTLLTEDILEFLIENRVNLAFSHDGPAYFLRGKDPLENDAMRRLWLQAYNRYTQAGLTFCINCVITQYNCDLFALDAWFQQRLPNVPYKYEGVVIVHSANAIEFTSFLKHQRLLLDASIQRAVLGQDDNRVCHAFANSLKHILRFMTYRHDTAKISAHCDAAKPNVLSIDMQGNILSCHNVDASQRVGHVNDAADHFVVKSTFKHWSHRAQCQDCFCLVSCRGNCMRSNDEDHQASCRIQEVYHTALMKAALGLLYNDLVIDINKV